MQLAIRGFVVITVVEVKCGRRIIDNIIMRSALDVIKKYVVDVASNELAICAMKQIVGFVDLTNYLFFDWILSILKFVSTSKNVKSAI